jgi:glutamate-1-semialdehyde 2,1-aminomutase
MNILNEGYSNAKHLFKSGYGSKIFDQNNKKFLDLTSAGGTSLLGHNNKVFRHSVKNFLNKKYSNFALPNEHAKNLSFNLKRIFPQFSKFIFSNSGAEANMKAIRIARAVTKRDKIINITGSWHGSIDQFLFSTDNEGKKISLSSGLEKKIEDKIIYAPYNNFKKTKQIVNKHKNEICCVIIEPIQGCLPSDENMAYISSLSEFCKKKKIILILDEIVTGLRTDCSSVQNKYNLYSDISTFGKAFGNSFPIGFIGISKKIEKIINKKKPKVFFGGTFSANSFSTYLANQTLKFLIKNKKKIFNDLEFKSEKFFTELNNNILKKKLCAKVIRFKSVIRIIFSNKNAKNRFQRDFLEKKNNLKKIKFINFLKKNNIIFPTNGIIFLNTSFSINEIKYLIKIITKGLNFYFA